MSYDVIKQQLKNNQLKNCYIFFGEEEYLKLTVLSTLYKTFCNKAPKDLSYFEFNNVSVTELNNIIDCCDAYTMMGGNKLVVVNDLELFSSKDNNSQTVSDFIEYMNYIPSHVCVVFYLSKEFNLSKTSKLYKKIKKVFGDESIIEYKFMDEQNLAKWIYMLFKKEGKKIDKNTAVHLIDIKEGKMEDILMEVQKLISYCSDRENITKEDIDNLCIKSNNYRIFALTDAISQKNCNLALKVLESLKEKKVLPSYIIIMLSRQFKSILRVNNLLKNGLTNAVIASQLKIKPFLINKYQRQSRNFNDAILTKAVHECGDIDINIKSGKVDPFIALEIFIVKYTSRT